jgi:hypothetical protein
LGHDGLRYALLTISFGGALWTATHFFLAARTVREDMAEALASDQASA